MRLEKVPAAQVVHAVASIRVSYVPGSQALHAEACVSGMNVPTWQEAQRSSPRDPANLPGEQA